MERSTLWNLAFSSAQAQVLLDSSLELLGEDCREGQELKSFFHDLRDIHFLAHRDLEECKTGHRPKQVQPQHVPPPHVQHLQQHIQPPPPNYLPPQHLMMDPDDLLLMSSSVPLAPPYHLAPLPHPMHVQVQPHLQPSKKGGPFRFKQEEVEFVRGQRNGNVSVDDIMMQILEKYPRWLEVPQDRLQEKIKSVRKKRRGAPSSSVQEGQEMEEDEEEMMHAKNTDEEEDEDETVTLHELISASAGGGPSPKKLGLGDEDEEDFDSELPHHDAPLPLGGKAIEGTKLPPPSSVEEVGNGL